jgi:hypothetical protein
MGPLLAVATTTKARQSQDRWRCEPHDDGWGDGTTMATNDSDDNDNDHNVVCHGRMSTPTMVIAATPQ